MMHRISLWVCFVFLLSFIGVANAQHITQLSPPNITFRAIGIADSTHSMVVGDSASVFTSTGPDSMRTWHVVSAPCDKSHRFNGVSYYELNRAAIITDEGLIFTTSNVGASWQPSGVGLTGQTLRAITHTERGSLLVVGDSGIILRSVDSGATWSKLGVGTTYNINSIAINPMGKGYFVGAHGLIGRTTDFGATWASITDTITNLGANREPITFRGVAINPSNDSGMAVGDSGGVARTLDGTNWEALSATAFGYPTSPPYDDSVVLEPVLEKLSYSSVVYTGNSNYEWRACGDIDLMYWFV